MTTGIVFYLHGSKLDILVPVALWSLRKYYQGPIHVVCQGIAPETMEGFRSIPGLTVSMEQPNMFSTAGGKQGCWCRKAFHHTEGYPFDVNMYYDWDHVWYGPIDDTVFARAGKHGICSTINPHGGPLHSYKDLTLKKIMGRPAGSEPYRGLNGGFVTASRNHPMVQEWMRRIDLVMNSGTGLNRNPEEFALTSFYFEAFKEDPLKTSYCIGLPGIYTGPQAYAYKCCAAHGAVKRIYYLDEFWKCWHELYDANFMGYRDRVKNDKRIDGALFYWFGHYSDKLEKRTPKCP